MTCSINRSLVMWNPLVSSHADVEKPGRVKSIFNNLTEPLTRLWMLFCQMFLTSSMCIS